MRNLLHVDFAPVSVGTLESLSQHWVELNYDYFLRASRKGSYDSKPKCTQKGRASSSRPDLQSLLPEAKSTASCNLKIIFFRTADGRVLKSRLRDHGSDGK